MAVIFHKREKDSFLYNLHPGIKFLFLLLTSISITISNATISYYLFIFLFFVALLIKLPILKYLKEGFLFIILAIFIFLSEYFSSSSFVLSLVKSIKFISIILLSFLLTDTTSPSDIARGLGSSLSKIFSTFAWQLASIVELTIAMIPLIFDTINSLNEARKSRGDSFFRHPIKSVTDFSISAISSLIEASSNYVDALESRSYNACNPRYCKKARFKDYSILVLAIVILIGTLWTK